LIRRYWLPSPTTAVRGMPAVATTTTVGSSLTASEASTWVLKSDVGAGRLRL
jgi:hypothetical protein